MPVVLAVIMAFSFMPSIYGKVKLSPTIEFSGKGKDKMPSGEGILELIYDKRGYRNTYGKISGEFKDSIITDARMTGFGIEEPISGTLKYKFSYNKDTKTSNLRIRIIDGFIGKVAVSNTPIFSYTQIDKNKPQMFFGVILNGNHAGIGIEFKVKNDTIVITKINNGSPAESAGLKEGDYISSVDNINILNIGITEEGLQKLIRGPKGSTVKLKIIRPDEPSTMTFEIQRENIYNPINFMSSKTKDSSWNSYIDKDLITESIYKVDFKKKDIWHDTVMVLAPYGYHLVNDFYISGENYHAPRLESKKSTLIDYSSRFRRIVFSDGAIMETKALTKDDRNVSWNNSKDDPIYKFRITYPNHSEYVGTIQDSELFHNEVLLQSFNPSSLSKIINFENIPSSALILNNGVLTDSAGNINGYYNGLAENFINQIRESQPKIIEVKKAGTLLSSISPDELKTVQNLSIVGYLDEKDLKIITDLGKELIKLDLSLAYTSLSEEAKSEQVANTEAVLALFGLMGVMADAQYSDYNLSTSDYMAVKSFTSLIKQASSDVKVADKKCIIPSGMLDNMPKLVEVKLPIWCNSMNKCLNGNNLLRYVELPPKLKQINGSFCRCPMLTEIEFPASLEEFDNEAFKETTLKEVNLSKNSWMKRRETSWLYPGEVVWLDAYFNIENSIRLPKNIERIDVMHIKSGGKIYCPKTVKYCNASLKDVEIYCESSMPFKMKDGSIRNCTIYVPKGSITAWYAAYGKDNKIVEY